MLKIVTRNNSSKLMDAGRQMNLADKLKVSNGKLITNSCFKFHISA